MKGRNPKRLVALLLLSVAASFAHAQAKYAATGPGSYIALGGTVSAYEADYGKRLMGGGTLFLDAHLYRRIGAEAEVRSLSLHSDNGTRQSTYLIGPKLSALGYNWRPYAKFLVGRGHFTFPFGYAQGSYFVLAPGGGVDWRVRKSRLILRLIDVEYQIWPGFTYGALHPYGVSTGLSFRIF